MKLCVFCVHFSIDMGTPDYSDVTPGESAQIECAIGKWSMDNLYYHADADVFRRCIEAAGACPDYKEVKR